MKKLFLGVLAALALAAGGTFAGTLDDVKHAEIYYVVYPRVHLVLLPSMIAVKTLGLT